MIDLDVESVVVAAASIGADPVVQVVVGRGPDSYVGQREVLHHLQRHGVDQVAGPGRQRIGRARQLGVAGADVGSKLLKGIKALRTAPPALPL